MGTTCVCPETDADLCARLDLNCGVAQGMDTCGLPRSVNCGGCTTACSPSNTCYPECAFRTPAAQGTVVTGNPTAQDVMASVSPTGEAILVVQASPFSGCGPQYSVAFSTGDPVNGYSAAVENPEFAQFFHLDWGAEQGFTYAPDVNTATPVVVGVAVGQRQFLVWRAAGQPPAEEMMAAVNADIAQHPPGTVVDAPVMSADGLTFLYRLMAPGLEPEVRMVDRPSLAAQFIPPGVILPNFLGTPTIQYLVTGISHDKLTLFLMDNFTTYVVERATLNRAFVNAGPGMAPLVFPGYFRVKPLPGCNQLLANQTANGCPGEEVVLVNSAQMFP